MLINFYCFCYCLIQVFKITYSICSINERDFWIAVLKSQRVICRLNLYMVGYLDWCEIEFRKKYNLMAFSSLYSKKVYHNRRFMRSSQNPLMLIKKNSLLKVCFDQKGSRLFFIFLSRLVVEFFFSRENLLIDWKLYGLIVYWICSDKTCIVC